MDGWFAAVWVAGVASCGAENARASEVLAGAGAGAAEEAAVCGAEDFVGLLSVTAVVRCISAARGRGGM
ncbi:hypothetical protein AA0473_0645 [Acetobacter orleanensis NRIC 0473]|uniref:Uncharacterized protein n=1 Tax=Acetobacter orleanensis TaxID=104099 RepID=A0A4Y3TLI1_9PROT|nr:hypothetical protein Abol_021_092 [Acetobacter orleanensis JCM 7639]GBR24489.1 hypothetical protein AA0473_0645 [Acetobacter orleanensis NRIC 0473]GEB82289.1 hypothetical protein AOR01nite_07660 [Acetobacter orleanensis]